MRRQQEEAIAERKRKGILSGREIFAQVGLLVLSGFLPTCCRPVLSVGTCWVFVHCQGVLGCETGEFAVTFDCLAGRLSVSGADWHLLKLPEVSKACLSTSLQDQNDRTSKFEVFSGRCHIACFPATQKH